MPVLIAEKYRQAICGHYCARHPRLHCCYCVGIRYAGGIAPCVHYLYTVDLIQPLWWRTRGQMLQGLRKVIAIGLNIYGIVTYMHTEIE
jgi:hypothetical protein